MKLLLISEHYAPEPNCVVSELSVKLAESNSVRVVTAHPNYPLGRFYPNCRYWLPSIQKNDGVSVVRLPMFPYHGRSSFKRSVSFLSFLVAAVIWCIFFELIRFPSRVIVYQTPFTTGLIGLPFKFLGSKLIFICVDLWPESLIAAGLRAKPIIVDVLYKYSRWINKQASWIITSTNGMRERYISDGVNSENVEFIPVWVDGDFSSPPELKIATDSMRRIVTYAGNLGPAQDLRCFIHALSIEPEFTKHITLQFVGDGLEESKLRDLAKKLELSNVTFFGRVSPNEAFKILCNSHATIAHLGPSKEFEFTLPSKIASCLAAGRVFFCGLIGEAAKMFSSDEGIFLFEPSNKSAIFGLYMKLIKLAPSEVDRLGSLNRKKYLAYFDKEKLIERYVYQCLKLK